MTLSLVTGGAGFVGRHLVAALKARGETVRVLDLAPSDLAETVIGSVENAEAALRALNGADYVFHLAGNAQLWAPDAGSFERVNHLGTRLMLEAARSSSIKRFVHCSSLTTLVGRATPLGASAADETRRLAPGDMLGPYPHSKLQAERAVEEAVNLSGMDAVIAIPTEPLGAGDRGPTPPTKLILDLLAGRTPATIDCMLNFVDVTSLADGLIAARDRGRRGERYLLGGDNVSMRGLLETLERMTGKKMPRARLPYAVAFLAGIIDTGLVAPMTGKPPTAPLTGVRLAGRRVEFSSVKANAQLDWRSKPFEAALQSLLDWLGADGAPDRAV